jgi:uncharacterized protein YwqG
MDRGVAIECVKAALPAPWRDAVIAHLEPAIRIAATRWTHGDPLAGRSRWGGDPELPDDWQWPTWKASIREYSLGAWSKSPPRERHLDFLGQFNLEEVASFEPHALPGKGMLYFFYDVDSQQWGFDPDDRGCAQVLYYPGELAALKPRPCPIPRSVIAEPCIMRFSQEWTAPDPEENAALFASATDRYELAESLGELRQDLGGAEGPEHQLFGHSNNIQGPMRLECQLAFNGVYAGGTSRFDDRVGDLEPGAEDWRLLLQVDTDEDGPGWMWGDCGRIYFWIRKQDLARHDFSKCWLVLQCS